MKVAIIIDTWFPAIGGGQINAWEISKRLAQKGIKIDIITRNNGRDKLHNKVKNLKIYKLGPRATPESTFSKIMFMLRSFLFCLNREYDLIHVHPFLSALPAKLISVFKNKPIIITIHGTRLFDDKTQITPSRFLEKIILTKIHYDAQISVTKSFFKINNVNQNINYIPNSVNYQQFKRVKVRKARYPKILWVGRFDPIKRVDVLIKAMKIVNSKIHNSTLVLIGYGQNEDRMKQLAKKLKVKNVKFTGRLEGSDLIKEYKSSRVFVLPSASEGQPISLLEAKEAGLPIVASKTGDIPQLINKNVDKLVKPGDIKGLAKAIISLLEYH